MATGRSASAALFALSSLLLAAVLSAKPGVGGFSTNLIHRDSLDSPLHDSKHNHYTRIRTAISRSIARAKRFSGLESETGDPKSEVISANGEYLLNFTLGTPAFPILAIADTGSDLIWTQCEPCDDCYKQTAPIFDPKKSSTYRPVSCSAPACTTEASGFDPSCDRSNHCQYSVSYGDQSSSSGAVATETLTLGSTSGDPVPFRKTVFGCGVGNQGTFSDAGSGIVGLGNGPDSLIGQLDKSIGGKFSYCLVPLCSKGTKSSAINFGENAIVSGDDVVTTPLVAKDPATFYYLTLEAITVGKERIPFTGSSQSSYAAEEGNIIIDSGTTLLILPQDFYDAVSAAIQNNIDATPISDTSSGLGLCYNSEGFKAPELVANFAGGDVELNDYNAWIPLSDTEVCFAASASNLGIYGNLAQMNFLVGYDKEGQTVSFQPADCTRQN